MRRSRPSRGVPIAASLTPAVLLPVLLPFLLAACGEQASKRAGDDWSRVVNATWRVGKVRGTPVTAVHGPTLRLGSDGKAGGEGGVNNWFADYERTGPDLAFSEIGSTKMAGEPEAMAWEQDFFAAIREVDGWRLDGAKLELLSAEGAVILVLARGAP